MKITTLTIEAFLKGSYAYKIVNKERLKEEYSLASLKNLIEEGVYYIEKTHAKVFKLITKSLIFTNEAAENIPKDTNTYFILENPQRIFYKLCNLVTHKKKVGIHPTAIVDKEAVIGENVYIGEYSIIRKSIIEDNCFIDAHVIVNDHVVIKKNTRIEPNSYIGANGVAWIWDDNGQRVVQPQFGGVVIGEDCFIGSDVSIVRGSVNENTMIGNGTLIAHGSKIGHGSRIEELCHFANNVSLAGNSKVGKRSFLGAACVLSSHVSIADDTIVGAGAVVTKSFSEENIILAGVPAKIKNNNSHKKKLNGIPTK